MERKLITKMAKITSQMFPTKTRKRSPRAEPGTVLPVPAETASALFTGAARQTIVQTPRQGLHHRVPQSDERRAGHTTSFGKTRRGIATSSSLGARRFGSAATTGHILRPESDRHASAALTRDATGRVRVTTKM